MPAHHLRRRSAVLVAVLPLTAALAAPLATAAPAGAAVAANTSTITYTVHPIARLALATNGPAAFPYTPSQCVRKFGLACYSPQDIRTGYNVPSALTGAGQTIVIVDAYGSPTVQSDLNTFDSEFGLPSTTVNVIYPGGTPVYNPRQDHSETSWAEETSLDVQYSHAMAPGATIDLVVAANNAGNVLNNAESYAVNHHLGNVMSMSFGSPESAIAGGGNNLQLQQAEQIYQTAAANGMSVFASSADAGATNGTSTISASFPASSPYVTSVGGTDLFLSDRGAYKSEYTWNDSDPSTCPFGCSYGVFGATGGAPSLTFSAPSYQQGVTGQSMRATSDVSWNASVYTAVMVYLGFLGTGNNGFYFFGGTSEGSPSWAGVTALAAEAAGHPLGQLNTALYHIYAKPTTYGADFHDITIGNNSLDGLGGFPAGTGYDLPTGLGTPDVTNLIATLSGSGGGTGPH